MNEMNKAYIFLLEKRSEIFSCEWLITQCLSTMSNFLPWILDLPGTLIYQNRNGTSTVNKYLLSFVSTTHLFVFLSEADHCSNALWLKYWKTKCGESDCYWWNQEEYFEDQYYWHQGSCLLCGMKLSFLWFQPEVQEIARTRMRQIRTETWKYYQKKLCMLLDFIFFWGHAFGF